jgi:E3 ubiquitin-protein ligase RGLG
MLNANCILFHCFISATKGKAIDRVPLPPPQYGAGSTSFRNPKPVQSSNSRPSASSSGRHDVVGTALPASSASDNHVLTVSYPSVAELIFERLLSFHFVLAS